MAASTCSREVKGKFSRCGLLLVLRWACMWAKCQRESRDEAVGMGDIGERGQRLRVVCMSRHGCGPVGSRRGASILGR